MKKKILCIVGESGVGKTYVADYIEYKYGIKSIESHTDRPKRYTDETGHTWLTKEQFNKIKEEDMVAYTMYGEYRYCATKQDLKDWNTYVIDEPGLNMLLLHGKEFDVRSLRIYRDEYLDIDITRAQRALHTYIRTSDQFNFHIENVGTLQYLEREVDKIMEKYLNGYKQNN